MSDPTAIGARQEAKKAQVEARPDAKQAGQPSVLVMGLVDAVTGDTYTVNAQGDDGAVTGTYTRVRTVPEATLGIGDLVWLVFRPGAAGGQPVILATSVNGGGEQTGVFQGPYDLGFAYLTE